MPAPKARAFEDFEFDPLDRFHSYHGSVSTRPLGGNPASVLSTLVTAIVHLRSAILSVCITDRPAGNGFRPTRSDCWFDDSL
jgi:hypothetical protein